MKKLTQWKRSGIAVLAASALALTACAGGSNNADSKGGGDVGDGVLHIGTTTEVVNWTPLNSVSITDMWVMYQLYPSLQRLDTDGVYQPHAADSVEPSEDGNSVVIKLNKDFKWSDGEPITANDVKFTLDRLRDDSLLAGKSFIPNYDGTTVQDDTTAIVQMKAPSYSWSIDLGQSLVLIPEHVFADVPTLQGYSIENDPDRWVSGGSFTLTNIVAGQRYDFEPNEYYPLRAEGNEAVKGIEFQIYGDVNTMQLALRNNDIDVMAPIVPASAIGALENQQNIEVVEANEALNYTKLTFNASRDMLSSAKVRNALAGLVDTQAIIDNVLQGHGIQGKTPVVPALTEYQADVKPYKSTPDEVKKVLADAGIPDPTMMLTCDQGNSSHAKSAQLVKDMLAPAGVTVDIRCAERATSITNAQAGNFDLYIHKLGQTSSPSTTLYLTFDPSNPSGLNYNFVEDPEGVKLLTAAQTATTKDDYVKAVKAASIYFHDQAYMVPLYAESMVSAYNNARFDGYVPAAFETSTMVSAYSLAQVAPSK